MSLTLKPYAKYKASGVAWLGDVPEHWTIVPNRALFSESKECNCPEEEMLSVTITQGVIRQSALLSDSSKKDSSREDRSAYKLVIPGDIAYNKMRAWQGAIGGSDFRGIVSPAYVVQRLRGDDVPRYYHYLFRTPAFAKEAERWSYGITSDMWSLRPEHFKLICSCNPSANEQRGIVRVLDYMDRRIRRYIRAKQKLIKLLEEQKQVIIHQAVTGQIDVRTGKPYPAYKDACVEWLVRVPESWNVVPLKYLSKRIQNGATPPTSDRRFYDGGTVPWYGPSSCTVREDVRTPVRLIAETAFVEGRAREIRGPALLVVVIGATVGRMALMLGRGSTNQQITSYELDTTRVIPEFLLHQVRGAEQWLRQTASTATIPILDACNVSRLPVAIPSLEEQRDIMQEIRQRTAAYEKAIERAEKETELVREYRLRLIADAVTGKLDVREAAAKLPDETDEAELLEDENLIAEEDQAGEIAEEEAALEEVEV